MAPPNPNVRRAFVAMKALGISEAQVKPVLKKLLKLYDKNWELIEEDNYRVLADAIFEEEDTQKGSGKKKFQLASESEEEALANEECERPLKRRSRGEGSSSVNGNGNSSPSVGLSPSKRLKNVHGETSPSSSRPKSQITVTSGWIIPKDEPVDETPRRTIHPVSLNCSSAVSELSIGDGQSDVPASFLNVVEDKFHPMKPPSIKDNKDDHGPSIAPMESPAQEVEKPNNNESVAASVQSNFNGIEIASTPLGEVKISLSCSPELVGQNFRTPSLNELQEYMEAKCLRSYKIFDPNFSIMNLMKDMCSCFLELATNSSRQSQEKLTCVTPNLDVLKRSPVLEALSSAYMCTENHVAKDVTSQDGLNSNCLVVVPQSQLTPDEIRSLSCFNDITRGEETMEISWVNEISNEWPPSFYYIPRSIIFENASVACTLSVIRGENYCLSCIGNCLASTEPCACACQTGGFAYTSAGLLKEDFLKECISITRDPYQQCIQSCRQCPIEKAKSKGVPEPCKGHLKRKFIKECWIKCGCSKQCGNRVVQRGITHKLQVFLTPEGRGWGLRTLEKLPKGAFICEYAGEILTIAELYKRALEKRTCIVVLDEHWGSCETIKDDKALSLDATYFGNIARFINHRCLDANLIEVPVEVDTPDHHYYHLAFFTTRKIDAMEELTWDYGIDFDDQDHPVKEFQCFCGSKFCRSLKRAYRSKHVQNGR